MVIEREKDPMERDERCSEGETDGGGLSERERMLSARDRDVWGEVVYASH